ncbi:MAG: hypothetical protein K2X71_29260 [Methylobacterium sp.]|uniref:hypothetical protein n=1 Tax=Methylobacterium sp. TaxID=409 RepID=UPI00258C3786|nr:hypothetical protein [Methylobacterium sp.]MBY0300079.1 hypothetical protein [Methylobacterium sp.]
MPRRRRSQDRLTFDGLPLYPDEAEIARAVLGSNRAKAWTGLAVVLERGGLPRIDPLFGGRYWPAVKAFLDRRHHVGDPGMDCSCRAAARGTSRL